MCPLLLFFLFFFNDTATTEIYTLSLHDALPILVFFKRLHLQSGFRSELLGQRQSLFGFVNIEPGERDRKSTRLNSSHQIISYAVFCLKKKKQNLQHLQRRRR